MAKADAEETVVLVRDPVDGRYRTNRAGRATGEHEHHLYEGAVMVAYAMHILRTQPAKAVRIHPDGEHGKQLDFAVW